MMWAFIVGISFIGVVVVALVAMGEDRLNGVQYRQRIARLISARADEQNDSALRDEPYGTYGQYMPPKDLI